MSFLPYAPTKPGAWWLAGSGSAILHAGVFLFAIAGSQGLVSLAAAPPPPKPKFTVTLTPLDSDTIAGLKLQEGVAAADGTDGLDTLTALAAPETLDAQNPAYRLSAVAPETNEPQPASPAPPETAIEVPQQTPALETVEPLPAEATAPTQTLAATAPKSPISSVAPTAAPLAAPRTETVSQAPRRLVTATRVQPTTAPTAVPVVRPAPATPTATPTPQTTPVAQTEAPTAQDLAIAELLRRIRSAPPEPCLLALPRRDGETGVGIALIANTDEAISRFNENVLTAEDDTLRQTRTLVDDRQCAALTYIRQNTSYPATRLGLRLDTTQVPSGGRLTGTLRGTAGRYLTLLLIDNNGVVQDLQRFTTFSGNVTRFDVPVTRASAPRDTGQILLAVATRTPAPVLRNRAGQLATDVFDGLSGALINEAALGIATFDVGAP